MHLKMIFGYQAMIYILQGKIKFQLLPFSSRKIKGEKKIKGGKRFLNLKERYENVTHIPKSTKH